MILEKKSMQFSLSKLSVRFSFYLSFSWAITSLDFCFSWEMAFSRDSIKSCSWITFGTPPFIFISLMTSSSSSTLVFSFWLLAVRRYSWSVESPTSTSYSKPMRSFFSFSISVISSWIWMCKFSFSTFRTFFSSYILFICWTKNCAASYFCSSVFSISFRSFRLNSAIFLS